MSKIALIGGYGGADIGDESVLTTVMMNLGRLVPDAQFLALSPDPEYTSKYHGVRSDYAVGQFMFSFSKRPGHILSKLYRGSIVVLRGLSLLLNAWRLSKNRKPIFLNEDGRRLLNNLKDADILFNVGGGNLNSIFRWELYNKALTYLICKLLGTPIVLSSQTIGPLNNFVDRKILKFALNKVDVITLRDENYSRPLLRKTGVTRPIIKETADDAISLPPANKDEVKNILLAEGIEKHYPLIGINMKGFLRYTLPLNSDEKLNRISWILAKSADALISDLGAKIVFIPTGYGGDYDDRLHMLKIMDLMEHKDSTNIITQEYNAPALKGIVSQLDLAIGVRYHFIVFATTTQVPAIGIATGEYQLTKLKKGILGLMEQEEYALDSEETSVEEIVQLAKTALLDKDKIKKKLQERTKILAERSLFTIQYAAKLLSA